MLHKRQTVNCNCRMRYAKQPTGDKRQTVKYKSRMRHCRGSSPAAQRRGQQRSMQMLGSGCSTNCWSEKADSNLQMCSELSYANHKRERERERPATKCRKWKPSNAPKPWIQQKADGLDQSSAKIKDR